MATVNKGTGRAAAVKTENAAVKVKAKAAPSFLDEFEGEGTEDIGARDTSSNYLKLAQSNTPEVVEGSIEELTPGCFFSSLNGMNFGKKISLIVLKYEVCWNVWKDRESGGGLVGRHPIGGIPTVPGEKGKLYDFEGNIVAETQNYFVLVEGHEDLGIMIFSLSSTMLKYGRKWNTMLLQSRTPNGQRKAPIFQNVWRIESVLDGNSLGKWYNIGAQNSAAIEAIRTITQEEYDEHIADAFEVVKMIPSLTAPASQNAIEDHSTLDGV